MNADYVRAVESLERFCVNLTIAAGNRLVARRAGIDEAVEAGKLDPIEGARQRAEIDRSALECIQFVERRGWPAAFCQ